MFKYDSEKHKRASELKGKGLTYAEIGAELQVTRQRSQQLCRPPAQIYELLRKRSGGKCERCFVEMGHGHAHHIRYGIDRWNLADLLYLCNSCHATWHHPKTRPEKLRTEPKDLNAAIIGRLGGSSISEAKRAASRANVAKARATIAARKAAQK